jgi:hypothetical protein
MPEIRETEVDEQPEKKRREIPARPIECDFIDTSLSIDALVARRAILSLQMGDIADSVASIETQIATAQAAESTMGVYRDAEWVRRVHSALRHFERQRDEHTRAIENISRRIAYLETAEKSRERAFMAAAEELLPIETMRELWRRVDSGDDRGHAPRRKLTRGGVVEIYRDFCVRSSN